MDAMKWLTDIIDRRKNKKTMTYKSVALPDGETRAIMVSKSDAPQNAMGMSAGMMLEHWRMYGGFDKLEAGYAEPSLDAAALCAGCMFFLRNPWGVSDTCQMVNGNIVWYGTCKLRIDANEQAAIVYAEDIGDYAEKAKDAKDAKARALPAAKTKKQYRITVNPMDKFVGGSFVAKSLADGVTCIEGRLASGSTAVYAYTMADDTALARGRAMIDKEAAQTVEVEEFVSFEIPIAKRDEEKRIVYGVVMQPDVEDLHSDIMSADDIEKACHTYTAYCRKVNDQHDAPIRADVVENYIAPVDFKADNGSVVKKGSWVQATKIFDDKMWAMVKSGERTGYSYEGWGMRTPVA